MSNPTKPYEEFPEKIKVGTWEEFVIRLYRSMDCNDGPIFRARMHSIKVLELRLYKKTSSPEHEFVVAKFAQPPWFHVYLRIERCVDGAAGKDDGKLADAAQKDDNVISSTQPSQSTSSLTPSASVSISMPSQLPVKAAALDMVHTIHRGEWPSENSNTLVRKTVCNNNCPATLLHLAILANVVHNNSPEYHTFQRQCHWYADTLLCAFHSLFPNVTQEMRGASGTWNWIPIHDNGTKESKETVLAIKSAFEERRNHVDGLVCIVGRLRRHYTDAHDGRLRSMKAKTN